LIVSKSNSKTRNHSVTGQSVQSIFKRKEWKIETQTENYLVEKLILAQSNPKVWEMLQILVTLLSVGPFLFTFNIKDSRIKELPELRQVTVTVKTYINRFINYTLGMAGNLKLWLCLGRRILHDKKLSVYHFRG
jgi:hypothetical protein